MHYKKNEDDPIFHPRYHSGDMTYKKPEKPI